MNNINILTFNRRFSEVYSVLFADTQYGNSYFLDGPKTAEYVDSHYSRGYINNSPVEQDTGLLPPGVKAIFPNIVVFERPPAYQNVFYIPDTVHQNMLDTQQVYRIPLPWQLYIAVYNTDYYLTNVYMYFMDGPLNSVDQNIYAPFIPNFYANGFLCRPNFSTMDDIERYSKDISGVITSAFDWVWNNGTNHDLTECMAALPKYIDDIDSTVIKNKTDYFIKEHLSFKLSVRQVMDAFSSWEQIDIKDILNYKWVPPVKTLHDNTNSGSYDQIQDSSAYHDHLQEWLYYYYEDEDEESIESRMENDEYDQPTYIHYLIEHGYVFPPSIKRVEISYSDMLNLIFSENEIHKNHKVSILNDIAKIAQIFSSTS